MKRAWGDPMRSQRVDIPPRRAQDELSALEQNAHLAMSHHRQQFHLTVREHQQLAHNGVSLAVLDSSARLEVTLKVGIETGTTKQFIGRCSTENDIFFIRITKLKKHFGGKIPVWCMSTTR